MSNWDVTEIISKRGFKSRISRVANIYNICIWYILHFEIEPQAGKFQCNVPKRNSLNLWNWSAKSLIIVHFATMIDFIRQFTLWSNPLGFSGYARIIILFARIVVANIHQMEEQKFAYLAISNINFEQSFSSLHAIYKERFYLKTSWLYILLYIRRELRCRIWTQDQTV